MNRDKSTFFHPDEKQKRFPKNELLELKGVTARKLTYWQDEGLLSRPVLHKGQGGKSYYNGLQYTAVQTLAHLQSAECKQSVNDIKRILSRLSENGSNSCVLKAEPAAYLWPFLMTGKCSSPRILDDIKNGKKVFTEDFGIIDYERHEKSYIEKNGRLLKIIHELEFDSIYYLEAEPIIKFADNVVDEIFGLTYELGPETDRLWDTSRSVFIELNKHAIMLPPSYFYDGKVYYSRPDISCGSFLVCFASEHGLKAAETIVERIKEDMDKFFCFPHASGKYSGPFLRFKKEYELVRDALCDLEDIRLDGSREYCDTCAGSFFEDFMAGRIRMKPNCIDNTIMFQGGDDRDMQTRNNETHLEQK